MIALRREPPTVTWADEDLVHACLAGKGEAWEALLRKYQRLIHAIPFRYGATADDAADIFQAVCVELYNELPKLRKVESLRSWLTTVTARQSLKWKRGTQRREEEELDAWNDCDPAAVGGREWQAQAERAQLVSEAMARLTGRCRTLIERLFFEDPPRPYEEVARELGLATGSMGFTRGRCLDRLRKALEELGY